MFSTDATTIGLNYIAHISNNITFFPPNIFHPRLGETAKAGVEETEDSLYLTWKGAGSSFATMGLSSQVCRDVTLPLKPQKTPILVLITFHTYS